MNPVCTTRNGLAYNTIAFFMVAPGTIGDEAYAEAPPLYAFLFAQPEALIHAILSTHMILHLRSWAQRDIDAGWDAFRLEERGIAILVESLPPFVSLPLKKAFSHLLPNHREVYVGAMNAAGHKTPPPVNGAKLHSVVGEKGVAHATR